MGRSSLWILSCALSCDGVGLICRRYLVHIYLLERCFVEEFVESVSDRYCLSLGVGRPFRWFLIHVVQINARNMNVLK